MFSAWVNDWNRCRNNDSSKLQDWDIYNYCTSAQWLTLWFHYCRYHMPVVKFMSLWSIWDQWGMKEWTREKDWSNEHVASYCVSLKVEQDCCVLWWLDEHTNVLSLSQFQNAHLFVQSETENVYVAWPSVLFINILESAKDSQGVIKIQPESLPSQNVL